MLVLIDGVVKLLLSLANGDVPSSVAALYQSITAPAEGVAVRLRVPASQRTSPFTETTVGTGFTAADCVTVVL